MGIHLPKGHHKAKRVFLSYEKSLHRKIVRLTLFFSEFWEPEDSSKNGFDTLVINQKLFVLAKKNMSRQFSKHTVLITLLQFVHKFQRRRFWIYWIFSPYLISILNVLASVGVQRCLSSTSFTFPSQNHPEKIVFLRILIWILHLLGHEPWGMLMT